MADTAGEKSNDANDDQSNGVDDDQSNGADSDQAEADLAQADLTDDRQTDDDLADADQTADDSTADDSADDDQSETEEPLLDEIDVEPLGRRVRALRHNQKLSLSEVSRLTGLSKGYLSQVERSPTARPSASTLFAIARALGTTLTELIDDEELELDRVIPEHIPDSLRAFSEEAELPPVDIEMLAGIRYRGAAPGSKDDWRFLYEAIRRSVSGYRDRR